MFAKTVMSTLGCWGWYCRLPWGVMSWEDELASCKEIVGFPTCWKWYWHPDIARYIHDKMNPGAYEETIGFQSDLEHRSFHGWAQLICICFVRWMHPKRTSWRHQMETFSALLVLCAENSPVTMNSPHNSSDGELWCLLWSVPHDCLLNRLGWVNNREAGDLRHHRAHYDIIVMSVTWINVFNYGSLSKSWLTYDTFIIAIYVNKRADSVSLRMCWSRLS